MWLAWLERQEWGRVGAKAGSVAGARPQRIFENLLRDFDLKLNGEPLMTMAESV